METVVSIPCGYHGCSKMFTKLGACNQHRKSHERLHKCSICDKFFGLKTDRDRHRIVHKTTAFKFKCKYPGCGFKGTPRRDYLLKHMRLSHENAKDSISKNQIRQYYQESTSEEKTSELEEAAIRFLEAVSEGDEPLAREMISAGVDIHSKDSKGTTAGDIASTKGHLGIMQLLVATGVNINANTSRPWLHQALRSGHLRTAEFLLRAGADPDAWPSVADSSSSVNEEMNLQENTEAVTLLKRYGGKVSQEQRLQLLLNYAIRSGDMSRVLRLFELGAVAGQPGDDGTLTGRLVLPLHAAAQKGTAQLVKFLLDQGADVEAKTALGGTALSLAIERGDLEIAKLLLQAGSVLEIMGPQMCVSFQAAEYLVNSANRPMVNLLLESGLCVSRPDLYDGKIILPRRETAGTGGLLYSGDWTLKAYFRNAVTRSLVKLGGYDEATECRWRSGF